MNYFLQLEVDEVCIFVLCNHQKGPFIFISYKCSFVVRPLEIEFAILDGPTTVPYSTASDNASTKYFSLYSVLFHQKFFQSSVHHQHTVITRVID